MAWKQIPSTGFSRVARVAEVDPGSVLSLQLDLVPPLVNLSEAKHWHHIQSFANFVFECSVEVVFYAFVETLHKQRAPRPRLHSPPLPSHLSARSLLEQFDELTSSQKSLESVEKLN